MWPFNREKKVVKPIIKSSGFEELYECKDCGSLYDNSMHFCEDCGGYDIKPEVYIKFTVSCGGALMGWVKTVGASKKGGVSDVLDTLKGRGYDTSFMGKYRGR